MDKPKAILYEVNKNVRCLKCGHKGAIQGYGEWYENGLGNIVDEFESKFVKNAIEEYRDNPHMNHYMGFGGTVPWECTNCGNVGLIDIGGLEGYKQAFERIKDNEKYIKEFVDKIQEKYPDLTIKYEYDSEDNTYDVWHNSEEMQFRNSEFLVFVGQLIKEILDKNGVYNFSFGYDYKKTKLL